MEIMKKGIITNIFGYIVKVDETRITNNNNKLKKIVIRTSTGRYYDILAHNEDISLVNSELCSVGNNISMQNIMLRTDKFDKEINNVYFIKKSKVDFIYNEKIDENYQKNIMNLIYKFKKICMDSNECEDCRDNLGKDYINKCFSCYKRKEDKCLMVCEICLSLPINQNIKRNCENCKICLIR
jgi:hypothetical protein